MSSSRKSYSGLAAAITLGALAAGCGSVSDMGFGGAKTAVLGAKATSNSPGIAGGGSKMRVGRARASAMDGHNAATEPAGRGYTAEAGRVRQLVLRHYGRLRLEDAVTHRSHAMLPVLARNRAGTVVFAFSPRVAERLGLAQLAAATAMLP